MSIVNEPKLLTERQKAVVETIRMKLTQQQTVNYMTDAGFTVSLATIKREKNKLNKLKLKRLYHIARAGFEDQHLERIDTLEVIQKEMWKNYHDCKDPLKRVVILEKIMNVQPYISSYYEATKEVIGNTQTEASDISDSTE